MQISGGSYLCMAICYVTPKFSKIGEKKALHNNNNTFRDFVYRLNNVRTKEYV